MDAGREAALETKVFECNTNNCGKGISTKYDKKSGNCPYCGGSQWVNKKRFTFWDTIRTFVKSRGKLLMLDATRSKVSRFITKLGGLGGKV